MAVTEAQLAALRADPSRAGILMDFDGTLAEIVDDPARARPLPGVAPVLAELARVFGLVAVISGRPVSFLASLLPGGVVLSGLYGLEVLRPGEAPGALPSAPPELAVWRGAIADVATLAWEHGPRGMEVEPKGLSLTLHYRRRPDLAEEVIAWATAQGASAGLLVRPAKMSVELHPPVEADKGTVVDCLAAGLAAVCFIGDDVGDLAAFDALERLAGRGVAVLKVAVAGPECPPELAAAADASLDGPAGVLELLRALAGRAGQGAPPAPPAPPAPGACP